MILGIWSCLTKPIFLAKIFFQLIDTGHCRRTVNRPIRSRNGADSTDGTVTSSVLASNECQSLFDRANYVETDYIYSLCKVSSNRK